jgi:hypothetical protein
MRSIKFNCLQFTVILVLVSLLCCSFVATYDLEIRIKGHLKLITFFHVISLDLSSSYFLLYVISHMLNFYGGLINIPFLKY